jgi:hypothetical protein
MGTLVLAETMGNLVLNELLRLARRIGAAVRAVRDFPAQAQQMDERCRGIVRHVQHILKTPSSSALVGVVNPQLHRLRDVLVNVSTFLTELEATRRMRQAVWYQEYERRFVMFPLSIVVILSAVARRSPLSFRNLISKANVITLANCP